MAEHVVVPPEMVIRHKIRHEFDYNAPDQHYVGASSPTPAAQPVKKGVDAKVLVLMFLFGILFALIVVGLWDNRDRLFVATDNRPATQQAQQVAPAPVPPPAAVAPAPDVTYVPREPAAIEPVARPQQTIPTTTPRTQVRRVPAPRVTVTRQALSPGKQAWFRWCDSTGGTVYTAEEWNGLTGASLPRGALHCHRPEGVAPPRQIKFR